jgi:nucleotide-binding universal stress UspA family protein
MIRLKNVLVATDFSAPSASALAYGRELARTFGATLTLLNVADNLITRYAFESVMTLMADAQDEYEKGQKTRLNGLLTDDDKRELDAKAVLTTSNTPADAIVEYARQAGVDVIVMGTNGRRALAHWFLGSVAESVVRLAPCPVLTVRSSERDFLAPDALAVPANVKG